MTHRRARRSPLPLRSTPARGPWAAVVALCLATGAAFGQVATLPEGIAARATLSESDTQAIRAYATAHLPGLASEDSAELQRARDAILSPLRASDVSVAFRLRYSEVVSPTLQQLVSDPDERIAFNALRVAGAIATDASVEAIRKALGDPRPPVRYGAALGSRLALDTVSAGRSALAANQIDAVIDSITSTLRGETDPNVAAGLITATESAGLDPATRLSATTKMSRSMSDLAGKFPRPAPAADGAAWARNFTRAIANAQGTLLDQLRVGKPEAQFATSMAELSGQVLAAAVRRLDDERGLSDDERSALRDAIGAAETSLLFLDSAIANRTAEGREQALVRAWESESGGGAGRFRAEALKWIGPAGLLTQRPYAIQASRFAIPGA